MNFDQTTQTDANISQSINLTNENFVQEVIEKSKSIPVIVDFWAPWCEPCKQIAPILDKLVASSNGRVALTKMNIDEHPEISQQLQIQSIPAILGFHNGQPVDGFVGVQPESAIKAFVEKLANLNGPSDNDIALEQGRTLYNEKNYNEALEIFGRIAQSEPDNITALSMLANCYLKLNEIDIAKEIISNIESPDKDKNQDYVSAKSQIDILEKSEDSNIDEEEIKNLEKELEVKPDNHQLRYDLAVGFMSKGKYEQAMSHLLLIIEKDRAWNDEAPRKSLLEIFNALGPTDDLAVKGRKKLSSILFS
tara:strand:- start:4945 stop:5865 length:921 start_codon:yes stop_codon:yes gene_type:complete